MQTHRNSFLAGVGCTLVAVAIWTVVFPVLREWFATIVASGGMAVIVLLVGVGVAGWAWGKTQTEAGGPNSGGATGADPHATGAHSPPPHNTAPPQPEQTPPNPEPQAPPKPTWQRAQTGPAGPSAGTYASGTSSTFGAGAASAGAAKDAWQKAREETRKKEEDRKRMEEIRKKREELEQERVKQREKDAREREIRERREKWEQERKERAAAKEKEQAKEKEAKEKEQTAPKPTTSRPPSPTKRHQQPTAKTATEDDAYSYRPYDKPKRTAHTATSASSIYSESSYAPSQSTNRTTPPPSHRGPYHSKDPDKIVLKAVYSFNNTFTRLPIAQLISGVGSVTDGLILRITTEGLFIDDDVRGVPQREWDVKAWTLKLVEVWCPHLSTLLLGASSGSDHHPHRKSGFLFNSKGAAKAPSPEESDQLIASLTSACKPHASSAANSMKPPRSNVHASPQTGEFKGLHVLRANIRDQEGKKYVFVLQEEEGWKVAVGLQRLRRGTQVRALGVSGMGVGEAKGILENMGWAK
ncbi:MAG: hypothetical protein LQ350_001369 [Teloschistes chrysophthalmus]|nr:MAG: hypothetical protein LQ350_001369 [Niorma chrysophthalma]